MLAWQNLIRVMTHEIMNSMTPITSLANTASSCLQEIRSSCDPTDNDSNRRNKRDDAMKDIEQALMIIKSRGEALMHFVENYRSLSQLPAPVFRRFRVDELFTRVLSLMTRQAQESGFSLTQDISPANLNLHADPDLLEQALINLIKNAIEAKRNVVQSEVRLTAALEARGHIRLQVADNGNGIAPDNLDSIFIPFFTTKQAGSGIGMSIVKQIISLNGGRINVQSSPGQGTVVTLNF